VIENTSFGSIQIDGKTYTTDVLIYPDGRVVDGWWRRHGHRLTLDDLDNLLAADPESIVIGTGVYGRMQPEDGLEKALRKQGIELIIDATGDAIHRFNRLYGTRRVGGGFHLTC
jgi:hypothetical protein